MVALTFGRAAAFAGLAFVAILPAAQAQTTFPYDHDLVLDARPMPGSKRVPILAVAQDGSTQIDLWCKRGEGKSVIAGETITIIIGTMNDEPCTPERAKADEDMLAALTQVTAWALNDDVVTFNGATPLRFRVATN
jgi:hypothetical protein